MGVCAVRCCRKKVHVHYLISWWVIVSQILPTAPSFRTEYTHYSPRPLLL